jgi:hypothetical protein
MAIQSPDRTGAAETGRLLKSLSSGAAGELAVAKSGRHHVAPVLAQRTRRARKPFSDAGFQHIAVHAASFQRHFPSVATRLA